MAHSNIHCDDKLHSLLLTINNKFVEAFAWIKALSEEEKEAIERFSKISTIGASTRIENAVLTNPEILWIDTLLDEKGYPSDYQRYSQHIKNKLSKDRERSIEEVAGCRKMLGIILSSASSMVPFTETELRGLHSELLSYYTKSEYYRGQYKTNSNSVVEQNSITGTVRTIFQTADAGPITASSMKDLIEWYNTLSQEREPILKATEFMYRFLAIHPFQDGNGRLGRGLFLLALLQSSNISVSTVVRYISVDRQIERHREDYYLALNRTSTGVFKQNPAEYKMNIILEFMLKMLDLSLGDLTIYHSRWRAERTLSESATQVLACFRNYPELRLNTQSIEEKTKIPRRTIINSLNSLLEKQLIQKYGQGASTRYQIIF
jgi:Fic family protein